MSWWGPDQDFFFPPSGTVSENVTIRTYVEERPNTRNRRVGLQRRAGLGPARGWGWRRPQSHHPSGHWSWALETERRILVPQSEQDSESCCSLVSRQHGETASNNTERGWARLRFCARGLWAGLLLWSKSVPGFLGGSQLGCIRSLELLEGNPACCEADPSPYL